MSEAAIPLRVTCGRCLYFKRTGTVVSRGTCRYFRRATHAGMDCVASGMAEADLPHCQTCGKTIFPAPTARSGSKFCAECWEAELQRREDKRLRWGLDLAAAADGGRPARCVAWCSWGMVKHQPQADQGQTGVMIGRALGGVVGAVIAATILDSDAGGGGGVPTFEGNIGLASVTDSELLLLDLGRYDYGIAPQLSFGLILDRSQREPDLAGVKVLRFPLSAIRPTSDGESIKFDFGGSARQVFVATVPEIPQQPRAGGVVNAARDAGALPPVSEFVNAVLLGQPPLTAASWLYAASNNLYWNDLSSWLASASLKEEVVFTFFSERAASVPELQADSRYVDVLWLLFGKLPSELQQQLARHWLEVQPGFLNGFLERLRARCQQQSIGHMLATRNFKRVESILTTGQ